MTRAVLIVTATILLAACGTPASSAQPGPSPAQVWHQYAQCVRDHGAAKFPDPVVDDQGRASFRDDAARAAADQTPESAMAACVSLLDRLPASARDDQPDPQQMGQFAQCMRDRGIQDWPDPDAQGRFHLSSSIQRKNSSRRPQIQAAWNGPCKRYDPSGSIRNGLSLPRPSSPAAPRAPPAGPVCHHSSG